MTIRRVNCTLSLVALLLAACGDDKGTGPGKNAVASITVSPPSSTLEVGEAVQLQAEVKNAKGTVLSTPVTWTSGAPTVASVSQSGMVTGLADGTASITASAGGMSASASVVVEDLDPPAAPSGVSATSVSNSEVEVTWNDNSDNEESFRIDREAIVSGVAGAGEGPALVAEEVGSVGPGVTSFRDTGLSSSSSYRYGVRACNKNGCTEHTGDPASVTTNPELVLETSSLADGLVGQAYEQTLEASGGIGSPTWSVSGGALPDGLTLSAAGVLSGTPTVAGVSNVTIQAQSGDGQTASADFAITIRGVLAVTTASLPDGLVGAAYSEVLGATGGVGPYAWSLSEGGMPDGLGLAEDGTISGTPTTAGTTEFSVQVLSEDGQTASATLSIKILGVLELTSTSLPSGVVGVAYSTTLTATGGDGSYTWSLTQGTLPDGLSLAEDGTISGTPTTTGSTEFGVQVLSGDGQTAAGTLSIAVYSVLAVSTVSLPDGAVGTAYSASLTASGGGGGHKWSLLEGNLPAGLSLGEDGTISGTPTEDGTIPFTVQVRSRDGQTASASYSIKIFPELLITTTSLPVGVVDEAYSEDLAATGGDGVFTWSLVGGTLPDGLSLGGDGTISGTPTTKGTSDFTVRVGSGDGQSDDADLSINILTVSYDCSAQSQIPQAECQALVALYDATGGEAWTTSTDWVTTDTPCSWYGITCSGGSVTSVHLGQNGLSGSIPNLSALTNLEELRLYRNSLTGSIPSSLGNLSQLQTLTLQTNELTGGIPASLGDLSDLQTLQLYANQLSGGIPSALGSLSSLDRLELYNNALTGTIPSELGDLASLRYLSLRQNQLTGSIPAALGNLSNLLSLHLYENELSGSIPASLGGLSSLLQMDIGGNSLDGSIPSELGNLTSLEVLGLYRNQLTGSIPASLGNLTNLWGLSLHENQLTGSIPSELGGLSGLQIFRLHGNELSGVVPLSVAQLGGQIQETYGTTQCSFGNTGNPDLTLTNNQDYRDADLDNDGAICSLGGLTLDLEVTTTSLPDGIVGAGYNASLVATGGDQPYTWTLFADNLPDGLTLAGDGTISGTPTTEETATFTVQVASNTDGQTATAELSITIYPVLAITTASLPGGTVGIAYSESLAATGGDGSYTWSLAGGDLPSGLTLGSDGTISGNPSADGTFNFTVQVDSGDLQTATAALSITVAAAIPSPNPD